MKIIKYFSLAVGLFFAADTFAQQISKAEVQVNGLTCSMCSRATETSLKSLGFIERITPDLNRNLFILTFKAGQQVDIDQIKDKVEDAGFSVGDLSATIHFKETLVDESGLAVLSGTAFQFSNVKNKTLNGPVTARIIDKNFIPSASFKENVAAFKSATYQSGKGLVNGRDTRIFHLSI